jgi:hypothetical protein
LVSIIIGNKMFQTKIYLLAIKLYFVLVNLFEVSNQQHTELHNCITNKSIYLLLNTNIPYTQFLQGYL